MVIAHFKIGDKVCVHPDYDYFTTIGIDMVVVDVIYEVVDGKGVMLYRTNHPCLVHGSFYNDFELIELKGD